MSGNDLKKAGLKVTLPRVKVLEVLGLADPHHLSAEDVYKKLLQAALPRSIAFLPNLRVQAWLSAITSMTDTPSMN